MYNHTGGLIVITCILSSPNYHWNSLFAHTQKKREGKESALTLRAPSPQPCWCCLLLLPHWNNGVAAWLGARRSLEPRESRLLRTTHYTCFSCVSHFLRRAAIPNLWLRCHTKSCHPTLPPHVSDACRYIEETISGHVVCRRRGCCGGSSSSSSQPRQQLHQHHGQNLVAQSVLAFRSHRAKHRSKRPLTECHLTAHQYADPELSASAPYEHISPEFNPVS